MKATILGYNVEGTPEEILRFEELVSRKPKHDNKYVFNFCEGINSNVAVEQVIKSIRKKGLRI